MYFDYGGILLTEYFVEPKYRLTGLMGCNTWWISCKICLPIACVLTSVIMTKLSSKNIFNGLIIIDLLCFFFNWRKNTFLIRICSSFLAAFCLNIM